MNLFALYIHYALASAASIRVVKIMPRVISASVDDSLYSADLLRASEVRFTRLSHAASAIELRGSRQPKYATARPRKCKGRRSLRAASSLLLSETSNSARRSISQSGIDQSSDSFPSPLASDYNESCNPSPDHGLGNGGGSYPSTPASNCDAPLTPLTNNGTSEDLDASPFPLTPVPLLTFSPSTSVTDDEGPRRPRGRGTDATAAYRTPSTSPDRYISNRYTPQDASKTFRLGKCPQKLSSAEKLLRHRSAAPDPFGPLNVGRTREARISASANPDPRTVQTRTRTIGTTNVQHPPQDPLALQNRQASAGAIWNVGGGSQAIPSGPVRGVSDGRGGFISSGSNAPMFTSHFFDDHTLDEDNSQLEGRLAVALDIDQTRKVLEISRSSVQARSVSTGSIGIKRNHSYVESRTRWMNDQWVQDDSQSPARKHRKTEPRVVPSTPFRVLDAPNLRDDYYCTVLAYCHSARTLAVGLGNRVYLWSETFGVRYPPEDPDNRESTYVTSLAFSSTEGGHSILAIGRNTGHISLWSLADPENVRFQSHQPCAIACVSFKPVTTRRPSEHFGCMMATEELLVGDEVGNVYYYSVEWMNKQQAEIHGWTGAMTLMAKISVHSQQLCGLAWSPDGDYFATGANDNICCLFEVKDILAPPDPPQDSSIRFRSPLQTIIGGFGLPSFIARTQTPSEVMGVLANGVHVQRTRITPGQNGSLLIGEGRQKHRWVHSAAIKAIAFCPWQRGLIATGGGSNDRAIHFFHTFSGACLATINCYAQVTSLIWSRTRREIAATFGYAQPDHLYRVAVFSWPECQQVVAIPWASDMRALYAIPYPGGPGEAASDSSMGEMWYSRTRDEGCIVVACSDESVKFHEVWSGPRKSTGVHKGLLGGSDILEGLEGVEKEGTEVIR